MGLVFNLRRSVNVVPNTPTRATNTPKWGGYLSATHDIDFPQSASSHTLKRNRKELTRTSRSILKSLGYTLK